MKLITYSLQGVEAVGVMSGDGQAVIPISALGLDYGSMNALISGVTAGEMDTLRTATASPPPGTLPYDAVLRAAPIPEPRQDVICLGINYMDHAEESARFKGEKFTGERPYAVYFSKRVTRAVPDGGLIDGHPDINDSLDYEVELAVILGRDAKNVPAADAERYIFGYTVLNDVSARTLQSRHKQFYFAKGLDGFTPMGPWIVTRDEIPFPPRLGIRSYVNGEKRQDSNTENLIFSIPHVIQELSAGMTLKAGTIIATGTPSGVGMGFDPPRFLRSGDLVECEVEGIGRLTNRVK